MDRVNGSLNTRITLSRLEVGSDNKLYPFFREARYNRRSKEVSRKGAVEEGGGCERHRVLRKALSSTARGTGSERLTICRVSVGKDG